MAHKKAAGKTDQHISPKGKRLGVKVSHGQKVSPGMVLVRQKGVEFGPGVGAKVGRDHTLFSMENGEAAFGIKKGKRVISVLSK